MKEQGEDILGRKVVVVVVRMTQRKMNLSKVVGVGLGRRGAYQVHSLQEVEECAHHSDHHDSHNHHNNHQTRSHKDQDKDGHTLDHEGEVCETDRDHLVLLGVVVGHVVDHRNHDHVVVCPDLCRAMNHQNALNDHLYPLSNGQNELEEVEHD
jgi:ABC-type Zn2+ transport system substrate-binding protein/surface adhesin